MHISRTSFVIVAVVGLVSCRSKSDRSDPPPSTKPTPEQLLHKGEAAFVRELDDGSLRLVIGPNASCDGTRGTEIVLPHRLAPDGRETWTASSIMVRGDAPAAIVVGEPATTVRAQPGGYEITLDVKAANGSEYEARGTVVGVVCNSHTLRFAPSATEAPSSATMTIAGKQLRIRGAIRRGDDLELSDAPRSCSSTWVSGATLARTKGVWILDGERIAKPVVSDGAGLVVKSDRGTNTIALSGHGMIGAYTVELAGRLDILDCLTRDHDPKRRRVEVFSNVARGPLATGPDDRETLGCVIRPGGSWCYAHLPDGTSVGCMLSDFMTRYIGYDYIQFDWDQRLGHGPGSVPECTGVESLPSR